MRVLRILAASVVPYSFYLQVDFESRHLSYVVKWQSLSHLLVELGWQVHSMSQASVYLFDEKFDALMYSI